MVAKVVSKPSAGDLKSEFVKASKVKNSSVLAGCNFVLCGKLISHHTAVAAVVTNNGAACSDKVETSTTALLTSDDTDKQSSKVAYATKLNIPVLSERYLYDCVNQGKVLAGDLYSTDKKTFLIPKLAGAVFGPGGVGGFGTGFGFGGPMLASTAAPASLTFGAPGGGFAF